MNQSVKTVNKAKLKEWREKYEQHQLNKEFMYQRCFINFRTLYNALEHGKASEKTAMLIDSFYTKLENGTYEKVKQ